jgi:uncharacterized protein involved in outer membrane biogenesis
LPLQTTLLGLAIAIILALVAALVGPLLIDWSGYRSVFEAEASHLIGVDMRVTGAIEARLLPSPRLVLHDIELGQGGDKVAARALGIEFALGPLMRGQWHAAELHLAGARLRLGLDAAGRVRAPNIPINFSPAALSIDRLGIEDSRVTLTDAASGGEIVLDKLWFNGEARSLLGPFSGEGAAEIGGELYPFRVSTGRADDDGAIKVHLNVDPVSHPLSIEADGTLAIPNGAPSFNGTLSFARPVGIASARAASVTQPWRVSGKIKVAAASALMPQIELQYGSEEQGFKLTGTADFKFGETPRFDGVVSGRQIDLDRPLAGETGRSPPAAVVRTLAGLAAAAFRPTIPVQIGVGIDRITLGGKVVENLRGDISSNARGWSLDRFEFRAPGFTKVRLSGELAADAAGVAFAGPADIEAGDPRALAAWVEGRVAPEQSDLRPLHLRGDLTVSGEKLAIERLTAEFERKPVSGRLLYAFAAGTRPARLEAELAASQLDIDAALEFSKALLAGSNLQRPQDMTIKADIGHASFAGIDARNVSARLKVDGGGVQIDRLSLADSGGNSLSASGKIETDGHIPHGSLALDLDIKQSATVAALITRLMPANPAAGALDRIGRAKLHATLDVTEEQGATAARLALAGEIDAMRLDAVAQMRGDWAKRAIADLRLDGTLDASDGDALFRHIGLGRIAAAGKGSGQLTMQIAGPNVDNLAGSLRLSASGLSVNSRIAYAGSGIRLDDIDAKLGNSSIHGHLTFGAVAPRRVDGALEAGALDTEDLIASLVGTPMLAADKNGAAWSSAPFAGGVIGDVTGQVALSAQRAAVTPRLALRDFHTVLRFGKDAVSLDDMTGAMAGGRFTGQLSLRATDAGLTARGKLALGGADAATLLGAAARPPVSGTLDVAADVEGSGFSAAALIGSLRGSGSLALNDGYLAGLDPHVFDVVERAVGDSLTPDAAHVSSVVDKALESGRFAVKRAQGEFAISAGQARLSDFHLQENDAALALGGSLDLTDGALDARLVLSGPAQPGGTRPDIFLALSGPMTAPARTVDASALTGWLTLRAIEYQSKRLKAIESAAQSLPAPPLVPDTNKAPALPAPLNIKPAPNPRRAPGASVNPQH